MCSDAPGSGLFSPPFISNCDLSTTDSKRVFSGGDPADCRTAESGRVSLLDPVVDEISRNCAPSSLQAQDRSR